MTQELDLPTPPAGHFWRVTPVGDEAVRVELRRTWLRWFSIQVDWMEHRRFRFGQRWDFNCAAQQCAKDLIAEHQKAVYRDSFRWGDYS